MTDIRKTRIRMDGIWMQSAGGLHEFPVTAAYDSDAKIWFASLPSGFVIEAETFEELMDRLPTALDARDVAA